VEIVALAPQGEHEVAILLDPAAALEDFLGFGLVLPEIGGCGPGFDAGEFFFGLGRFKDSYADRQRGG